MAESKNFEISGKFIEKNIEKKFTKEISALNEKFAIEKLVSQFGSRHKIARRNISIKEVKEIKKERGK